MGWESFGVVGFDLGPLLEGQMRTNLKVLVTCLLLVLEVLVHCLYGGYNLHRFSNLKVMHYWSSLLLGFLSLDMKTIKQIMCPQSFGDQFTCHSTQ